MFRTRSQSSFNNRSSSSPSASAAPASGRSGRLPWPGGALRNAPLTLPLLLALFVAGCSSASPVRPSSSAPVDATAPATLNLGALVGAGTQAGHATIEARVQNGHGEVLAGVSVAFTADHGSLSADAAETDEQGRAHVTLTSTEATTVTATIGGLSSHTLVAAEPPPLPPLPPVPPVLPPTPPPTPTPTPTPPAPSYAVIVTSSSTSTVAGGAPLTLTATATPLNGASVATQYRWDCNGDGTVDATTTAPLNFTTCHYNSAGTITSRVGVIGPGAVGSGIIAVTVDSQGPLAVAITLDSATTVAAPPDLQMTVNLIATITSVDMPLGELTWSWDFENDGTLELITPPIVGSSSTAQATYTAAKTHTVAVTVVEKATGRTAHSVLAIDVP